MAYDPTKDTDFDAFVSRMDAAESQDVEEQLTADIGARREADEHPVKHFVTNLPKNIGIAGYKALVNTVDTLSDVGAAAAKGAAEKATGVGVPQEMTPSLSEQFPELMNSVRHFTDDWERNDTLSDDITQGVAQFTLPFLGWMKVAGTIGKVGKLATLGKAAIAEGVTAGSAFDPHEGRIADLVQMGRESDTRFGELLRKVAPDESLINQYIDFMTAREGTTPHEKRMGIGEGVAEGRWKNAVDAVVTSGAVAGLLKGAAVAHKGTKILVEGALEDLAGGTGSIGPGRQRGMVAFHGTPYDFEAFDLSKIGTGEGNQAYGYGLYFAEAEGTAKHYRGALSDRNVTPGSDMHKAITAMQNTNWDSRKAYSALQDAARNARDTEHREALLRAAEKVKAGNVKQLGKLMTVDIPDETVAKMVDWDAPMTDQPSVVRAAAEKLGISDAATGQDLYWKIKRQKYGVKESMSANKSSDADKYASEQLNALGVPGIRYLDEGSRTGKKGTSNLVLFDDKLVTITKKE